MKGPYCASRPEEVAGARDSGCLSGIADCIPIARRFPLTVLNAYSVLEGPLNSGTFVENSGGARDKPPMGLLEASPWVSVDVMVEVRCCEMLAFDGLWLVVVTDGADVDS